MEQLASLISAAVNVYALYPPNHPTVRQSVDQVIGRVEHLTTANSSEEVTYLLVGDDLLADGLLIRDTTLPVREFLGLLKQRGVERMTVGRRASQEEILTLVRRLSTGEKLESSENVTIGGVQLVMDDEPKQEEKKRDLFQQLELTRESWARFRVERSLPIDQLEELVWSLVDSVGATAGEMLPLARLREHDEYSFVNAVNVSLMVIAQGRSLGIWGPMLHAFGMAGLLHDIGKLTIPQSILSKPGKLDDAEWEVMKSHPREGASYLVEMDNAPPLAVIVAFEHHLRFDGRANYPKLRTRRMPHLASRMTAIADGYDAMCATRPYQAVIGRGAAIEVLRKRAGTFYDPLLVANFIRIIATEATFVDRAGNA